MAGSSSEAKVLTFFLFLFLFLFSFLLFYNGRLEGLFV